MYSVIRSRRAPPKVGHGRDSIIGGQPQTRFMQAHLTAISSIFAGVVNVTYFIDAVNGLDTNNGTSQATAWRTVGKANNPTPIVYQPGDVIAFRRGQNHNSTRLRPIHSGNSSNPILFTAYGAGSKPRIGNTAQDHNLDTGAGISWVEFEDLDIVPTAEQLGDHQVQLESNSSNITLRRVDIVGTGPVTEGQPHSIHVASPGHVIDSCFTQDGPGGGIIFVDNGGATVIDTFCGDCGADSFNSQASWTGSITTYNLTCDNVSGEECIDHKGSGTAVHNNIKLLRGGSIFHHTVNITINDSLIDMDNGTSRIMEIGGPNPDGPNVTFNRCIFVTNGVTEEFMRLDNSTGTFVKFQNVTFNACAFYAAAGQGVTSIIRCGLQVNLKLFNCSFHINNGNTLNQIVLIDGDFNGTVEARNNIFRTTGTTPNVTNNTGPWTVSNNLYDVGSNQNLGGTGSTTGDPNYLYSDPYNDNFLLLSPGSPAEGLGNNAYGPTTDLRGNTYSSPKNAGARARSVVFEDDFGSGYEGRFPNVTSFNVSPEVTRSFGTMNGHGSCTFTWDAGSNPNVRQLIFWDIPGGPYDELILTQEIRFENNYVQGPADNARGTQKLFGMAPSSPLSGGAQCSCPCAQWSFRVSSRKHDSLPPPATQVNCEIYAYWPAGGFQEQTPFSIFLNKNQVYSFRMHWKNNSASGVTDGFAKVYVDGTLVAEEPNVAWWCGTSTQQLAARVSRGWYQSFYGGSGTGWEPYQDSGFTLGLTRMEIP